MKILIAHNAYQQRGGEDAVVEAETALLRAHGHDVQLYRQHNDALMHMPAAAAAAHAIWSPRSTHDIDTLCRYFVPDVIHAHNTFPLISPSLYWAAARRKVPVVQTLHNFRLLCPQAIFLREGKICEACVGKLPWRAVAHKCYRDSAAQSAVVAGMLATHRALGTWRHRVSRYIALTAFARDKYIAGGLPAQRLRIKPNFVAATAQPSPGNRHGGLFVGRLSTEKGLDILAAALRLSPGVEVEAIGSGPLEMLARQTFGNCYLGQRPLDEIMMRMQRAQFLVLPSICYENFPRTIVEAYACGLPVIASRLGALPEIVRDGTTGLLFEPGNPADLAAKLQWAQENPQHMLRMGQQARAEYEARYTPEKNHAILMDIYEDAIGNLHHEPHAA